MNTLTTLNWDWMSPSGKSSTFPLQFIIPLVDKDISGKFLTDVPMYKASAGVTGKTGS